MKTTRLISLALALIMLALTLSACNISEIIGSLTGATTTTPPTTTTTTTQTPNVPDEDDWASAYDIITIAEALELCGESGNITTERYYIRGKVTSITNAAYGAMTIEDETGSISVYGTYSADGTVGYAAMTDKPYKDDEVLLHCILQNYNGTKEVKNARLIDFKKHKTDDIDTSEYAVMSVDSAREAEVGTKVLLEGTVASITYANGMKPSGFYLVDVTGSIYVYDADIAQRVSVGNHITIIGSKTYWILDKEVENANKFGYKGCCQIESATLMENDNGTSDFDKSWIETSTVKKILDTPVTENITTNIYKVTALVKKVPGNGFVNYYFYDLDGETGAYTYTQCNGSDFAWLDEFDGKICTVYLSPINAKSVSASCYFRLIPIQVIDEGFTFDLADTAKHVVEYYGVDQFLAKYTGNPKTELKTSISSELLGFEGATLSYSSSNENVVCFTEENGKTYLNCLALGTATVTITGSYNDITYSKDIEITVELADNYEYTDIKTAIDADVNDIVTIKGIVGPSIVNKDGFYLIDETGVIAILVNNTEAFADLKVGNEVILTGKRDKYNSKDGSTAHGVTCITGATILVNNYGDHEYSTKTFVTDKTLADLIALPATEDHSTTVYVFKATVTLTETAYYSNIYLTDGTNKLTLYSSSANQYNWLKAYAGQEITVEVVPCNWNGKNNYAGCVLSVITEDGKIFNTLNFDSNK